MYDGRLTYDEPAIDICVIDDARFIDFSPCAPDSAREHN